MRLLLFSLLGLLVSSSPTAPPSGTPAGTPPASPPPTTPGSAAATTPTRAPVTVPEWVDWMDETTMKPCVTGAGKPCADCVKCHEESWNGCSWLHTTLGMTWPTGIGSECVAVHKYFISHTWLWGLDPKTYTGATNMTMCGERLSQWFLANRMTWDANCGLGHEKCETQGRCSKCWKCRALVKKDQRCAETCKKVDFCHRDAAMQHPGSWTAFGACFANTANGCDACEKCERGHGIGQCGTMCSACNTCKLGVAAQYGSTSKHVACDALSAPCTTCLNTKMKKGRRKKWRMKARKVARYPVMKTNKKTRRAAKKERSQKRRAAKKLRRQKRRKNTPTSMPTTYAWPCYAMLAMTTLPIAGTFKCDACTTFVSHAAGSQVSSNGVFCPAQATGSPSHTGTAAPHAGTSSPGTSSPTV